MECSIAGEKRVKKRNRFTSLQFSSISLSLESLLTGRPDHQRMHAEELRQTAQANTHAMQKEAIKTAADTHYPLNSFQVFFDLCASAHSTVPNTQSHTARMAEHPPAPLSCLKWAEDGELSTHDTEALVNRLAACEKSRRGFKDHHARRRNRTALPISPKPLLL